MLKRFVVAFGLVFVVASTAVSTTAMGDFGLKEVNAEFTNQDGSPETQAGSHPFAQTVVVGFNTVPDSELGYEVPDGSVKDLTIPQPAGLVGDPAVVPRCSGGDFVTEKCSANSQVGINKITVFDPESNYSVPVYSLIPPPGSVMRLGFHIVKVPVTIELRVNSNAPYDVIAVLHNIPDAVPFYRSALTLWGVPSDPIHESERSGCDPGGCKLALTEKPFLTLPTSCNGPLTTGFEGFSWEHPETGVPASSESHDNADPSNPLGLSGCEKLGFKPAIGVQPTTVASESPTGLDFNLDVDDEGLRSSTGIAQSDIKKVVVALPEGMSVNPALAEGLSACSEADLGRETIGSAPGEGCPAESKIGTVEVETPLLEQTLKGSLFLATPYENPFHSLLALYVLVKNPETGIMLKIPGEVEPNATTGQLVSVFDDLPQLPFSHFRLSFREGERSPLVTPPVCGAYTTLAELTPYANPETVLHDSSTFQVTAGIGGGPCPTGGAQPFNPGLIAGTDNNAAGSYSPLDIRITRNDGEQEITGFSSVLPAGLTANLSGVPFCGEAQIASAKIKTGAQEEASPSCPVDSEIGHTLVGVGVGSVLAYTPGKLYMAGPYEGAPFSVVAITAAKVGPFDLGTVVVHLPLNINPVTAAVSIPAGASDQIPHIIDGIVIHVRDIRVYVDRPGFALNPTNCSPSSFGSTVIGSGANFANPVDDVPVAVNDPFQVANCANLAFKPLFKASTSGKTSRTNGASLNVKLVYPKAPQGTQADIKAVKVDLPKQLPSRLTTLQKACTSAQFDADPAGCPSGSRVGHATAVTPILPVPLTGPAYFVSYGGAKFPELVVVLQGYGVTIDLHGETFISKAGITSSTFRTVPDQPVTSFELTLPEGRYSALAANGNLCTSKLTMPTSFTAQNGATIKQSTAIAVTGCPKHRIKKTTNRTKKDAHGKKGSKK